MSDGYETLGIASLGCDEGIRVALKGDKGSPYTPFFAVCARKNRLVTAILSGY